MQPDRQKDPQAVALGQRGGQQRMSRMTAQERSAFGSYAAWTRWHPGEARKAKAQAEAVKLLIRDALKGKQLPLV
jgi:hypothetical protein